MKNWEAVDIIILILVTTISLSILIAMIKPLFSDVVTPIESGKLITGVITSALSIVSVYVGMKIKNKNN